MEQSLKNCFMVSDPAKETEISKSEYLGDMIVVLKKKSQELQV
jgi:hypothetical protein